MGRKGVGPRVDPGDGEGQRRQRQHQRAADMAGAEEDERPAVVAERLRSSTPWANAALPEARSHRRRRRCVQRRAAVTVPCGGEPARRLRAAARSATSARRSAANDLDEQVDVAAAALAEFGAERVSRAPRPWASTGRRARACATAIACHSSVPPPMVPVKLPSGWTIRRAPASRGAEPRVAATVTMAALPWRSIASQDARPDRRHASAPLRGADRAHDRLRRRRRVEARHDRRLEAERWRR